MEISATIIRSDADVKIVISGSGHVDGVFEPFSSFRPAYVEAPADIRSRLDNATPSPPLSKSSACIVVGIANGIPEKGVEDRG